MKKTIAIILALFVGIMSVNAESYYTNKYGVEFTKEQYDFFTEMYYEGYQNYMTEDDLKYFDINNLIIDDIETVYSDDLISPYVDSTTGTKKTLKISKGPSVSGYTITVVADWFQEPSVRSYDVIGARFDGLALANKPTTKIVNSTGENILTNIDESTNGFGQTFLLSGKEITITQTYQVRGSGTVYASYQHAKKTISAANSRKYTISSDGFGGVFKFTGTAANVYDNSQGVSISA